MNTEDLKPGQSLLTRVRKIGGNKFEIELVELIQKEGATNNVIALLNKSDDRFKQASPRRAWQGAEAAELEEYFGIDCSKIDEDGVDVNILNPSINDVQLRVQLLESLEPFDEWQEENKETAAKKFEDEDGTIMFLRTSEGSYIYTKSRIVGGETVTHQLVAHDNEMTTDDAPSEAETVVAKKTQTVAEKA